MASLFLTQENTWEVIGVPKKALGLRLALKPTSESAGQHIHQAIFGKKN